MSVNVNKLSDDEAKAYYRGWELHGFNLYVSDQISLQRRTPPVPEKEYASFRNPPLTHMTSRDAPSQPSHTISDLR